MVLGLSYHEIIVYPNKENIPHVVCSIRTLLGCTNHGLAIQKLGGENICCIVQYHTRAGCCNCAPHTKEALHGGKCF